MLCSAFTEKGVILGAMSTLASVCKAPQPALNATSLVVRFANELSTWRYFTMLRCKEDELCAIFLSGQGVLTYDKRPHQFIPEGWAASLTSRDGGRTFLGEPVLVVPSMWEYRGDDGINHTVCSLHSCTLFLSPRMLHTARLPRQHPRPGLHGHQL